MRDPIVQALVEWALGQVTWAEHVNTPPARLLAHAILDAASASEHTPEATEGPREHTGGRGFFHYEGGEFEAAINVAGHGPEPCSECIPVTLHKPTSCGAMVDGWWCEKPVGHLGECHAVGPRISQPDPQPSSDEADPCCNEGEIAMTDLQRRFVENVRTFTPRCDTCGEKHRPHCLPTDSTPDREAEPDANNEHPEPDGVWGEGWHPDYVAHVERGREADREAEIRREERARCAKVVREESWVGSAPLNRILSRITEEAPDA